jgi:hypothetical protein
VKKDRLCLFLSGMATPRLSQKKESMRPCQKSPYAVSKRAGKREFAGFLQDFDRFSASDFDSKRKNKSVFKDGYQL